MSRKSRMSRSLIVSSFAGLLVISSILGAFVLGVSLDHPRSSALVLVNSDVRFQVNNPSEHPEDAVSPQGVDPFFTYQGVLKDTNANPASGPVDLRFRLHSTIPNIVDFAILTTTVNPDASGAFQVEIDLPDSVLMSAASDLLLEIKEPGSSETIALVPVHYTPRAWVSDYARSAGSANTALSANTASQLTNDQTIDIVFSQVQFQHHVSYDTPKAARVGNVVTLQGGILLVGPISNDMEVCVLPEGFRPAGRVMLPIQHTRSFLNGGNLHSPPMRFEVHPDGRVIVQNVPASGTTPIISLNTVSFIVE